MLNNDTNHMLRRSRVFYRFFLVILIIVLVFVTALTVDHKNTSSFSANFADNVLRPVIGNQNTIKLESIFFGAQDLINKVTYKFVSSGGHTFNTEIVKESEVSGVIDGLNLNEIKNVVGGFSPTGKEGKWQQLDLNQSPNQIIAAVTTVRPDLQRSFAVVTLVQLNMSKLRLSAVAGKKEPGGPDGHPGPGIIPNEIKDSGALVAAFNGGFQYKDGQYGMIVGSETYLPLKKDLATLVIDKDSRLKIVNYTGQDLGSDNLVVRQNGDMLIEDSKIIPSMADRQYKVWGRTVTNSMYTWRSGIGVTKEGNLIYAVGPSIVPETLANALQSAGAVNAMQLDINPYWVRFVVFKYQGGGAYQHFSIKSNMYDGGSDFLNGYQKDFFYLYKR